MRINHIRRRFFGVIRHYFGKIVRTNDDVVFSALQRLLSARSVVCVIEILLHAFLYRVNVYVVVLILIDKFDVFGLFALNDIVAFAHCVGEGHVRAV